MEILLKVLLVIVYYYHFTEIYFVLIVNQAKSVMHLCFLKDFYIQNISMKLHVS